MLDDLIARVKETISRNGEDSNYLQILGIALMMKFEKTKTQNDIEEAIQFGSRAVSSSPNSHIKAVTLVSLAQMLFYRYQKTHSLVDLEDSLLGIRIAIDTIPEDTNDPTWSMTTRTMLEHMNDRTSHQASFRLALEEFSAKVAIAGNDLPLEFEETFLPEMRTELRGPGAPVRVSELPCLLELPPGNDRVQAYRIVSPEQLGEIMDLMLYEVDGKPLEGATAGESDEDGSDESGSDEYRSNEHGHDVDGRREDERESGKLEDFGRYDVDNTFAVRFCQGLKDPVALPHQPACSELCERWGNNRILSPDFELSFGIREISDSSTECCELCSLLCNVLRSLLHQFPEPPQHFRVFRQRSSFMVQGRNKPVLRICAEPGFQNPPVDIQIGFPKLPGAESWIHSLLLLEWLRVCDETHKCCQESDSLLPTRLLDVGDDTDPNQLQLYCADEGERGRYVTLSHCWGNVDENEKEKFCTYKCNIDRRRNGIDWNDLPKTFQDAVTVTRKMGIRFLWIDSICIIQAHNKCSSECGKFDDWNIEAKKMAAYYGSAYCTIGATSATASTDGFLRRRPDESKCIRVATTPAGSVYISETVEDFQSDVEDGPLNARGWVLQERALSRRMMHFSAAQTYWECGEGVRCETLSRMSNSNAKFVADPQFPSSVDTYTKSNRIRLFQSFFRRYSKLQLSYLSDKSVAISGLETCLGESLVSKVKYGIFTSYLHRSLLWRRLDNGELKRIDYPPDRKVSSWSWMAYDGEIDYLKVPFYQMEWSDAVYCHLPSELYSRLGFDLRRYYVVGAELTGFTRQLQLDGDDRSELILDDNQKTDACGLRCIVLGRSRQGQPSNGERYVVLVVEPLQGRRNVYQRAGIGFVRSRCILFNTAEAGRVV